MNYQLRSCTDMLEKIDAAIDARCWGYPREIGLDEVRLSGWYRMGDSVVFWLHRAIDEPEDDLFPHLAVAPAARGSWPKIGLHRALRVIGQLHDGKRLRFIAGPGFEDVEAALRSVGWYEVPGGLAISLGWEG